MSDDQKEQHLLNRLLETTQDIFIFESLQSGVSREVIKSVLRIDTNRVTVSKLLPVKTRKKGSEK